MLPLLLLGQGPLAKPCQWPPPGPAHCAAPCHWRTRHLLLLLLLLGRCFAWRSCQQAALSCYYCCCRVLHVRQGQRRHCCWGLLTSPGEGLR